MPLTIADKQNKGQDISISAALCLDTFKLDPDVGPSLDNSGRINNADVEEYLFGHYPDKACRFYTSDPDNKSTGDMYALGHYWHREYVDNFGTDTMHYEADGMDVWIAPLLEAGNTDTACGCWCVCFDIDDLPGIDMACRAAVEQGVVTKCDHTNLTGLFKKASTRGQVRFWVSNTDDAHKKLIGFLLQNGLLPKSNFRPGEYMDIRFMPESRSKRGKRRTDTLRLSNFINLRTGKWRKGMKP